MLNLNNQLAQNTPLIDDKILNTPPQESFDPQKVVSPEKAIETYLETQTQKGAGGKGNSVILDIDGKKSEVNSSEEFDTKYQSVKDILNSDTSSKLDTINPTAILLIAAIIIGLFVFIILNLRRSDYILRLEKEIDKLKDDKKSNY